MPDRVAAAKKRNKPRRKSPKKKPAREQLLTEAVKDITARVNAPADQSGVGDDVLLPMDIADDLKTSAAEYLRITGRDKIPRSDRFLLLAQSLIRKQQGDEFAQAFHPVVQLMVIGADPKVPVSERIKALDKAAKYVAPTLKSIELTGNADKPIYVTSDDAKQKLARVMGFAITDDGEIIDGEILEDEE